MKREEFDKLPAGMQTRVLGRIVLDGELLEDIDVGRKPFSPKYDQRISRQGGYMWASETDAEGLRYWLGKYREGAARGGQYADADRKRAANLERWLAWRDWEPTAPWTGERDRDVVTALPPSSKPQVHAYDPRQRNGSARSGQAPPEDHGAPEEDDCPI